MAHMSLFQCICTCLYSLSNLLYSISILYKNFQMTFAFIRLFFHFYLPTYERTLIYCILLFYSINFLKVGCLLFYYSPTLCIIQIFSLYVFQRNNTEHIIYKSIQVIRISVQFSKDKTILIYCFCKVGIKNVKLLRIFINSFILVFGVRLKGINFAIYLNLADIQVLTYNIKLMFTNFVSANIIQLMVKKLANDRSFQRYHQQNVGSFKLCEIKKSFHQMMLELKQYKINNTIEQRQAFELKLRKGMKIWMYSEYKLFSWISLWINFNSITQNQQTSNQIYTLNKIFPNKTYILSYQNQIILRKLNNQNEVWTQSESDSLKKIFQAQLAKGPTIRKELNWKFISYKLYTQYDILKLPQECRERWCNHIDPKLSKDQWTLEQDLQLLTTALEQGTKWAKISKILINRSEHMVKNRFKKLKNKYLKRQLQFYKHSDIKKMIRRVKISMDSSSSLQQELSVENNENYKEIQAEDKQICIIIGPQQQIAKMEANKTEPINLLFQFHEFSLLSTFKSSDQQPIYQDIYAPKQLYNDYSWLDEMMEQRNMNWMENQN